MNYSCDLIYYHCGPYARKFLLRQMRMEGKDHGNRRTEAGRTKAWRPSYSA
jgi:hypothetical protein